MQKLYRYQASTLDKRIVRGQMEAVSEDAVQTALQRQGLSDIQFLQGSQNLNRPVPQKISALSFTQALEKLLTLYESGLPLIVALQLTANATTKHHSALWNDLTMRVKEGVPLSLALQHYQTIIGITPHTLIALGEKSANLTLALRSLIESRKREALLAKRLQRMAAYPKLVLFLSLGMTLFCLLWLVPLFHDIFIPLGDKLPLPTRILLTVSNTLLENVEAAIFLTGLLVAGFVVVFKTSLQPFHALQILWQEKRQQLIKRLPFTGAIFYLSDCARWCNSLHVLLSAGCHLAQALKIVAAQPDHHQFTIMTQKLYVGLENGELWTDLIKRELLLPTWCQALLFAEQNSRSLAQSLQNIDNLLEQEIESRKDLYIRYLEPGLLFFLGLYVLLLLLAIYLPLFQLGQNI